MTPDQPQQEQDRWLFVSLTTMAVFAGAFVVLMVFRP